MTRTTLLAAVTAAALSAAACASNGPSSAAVSTESSTAAATTAQAGAFTDAQLRAYLAADAEISPLQARLASQNAEQQTQTRAQIAAILQRNSLSPTTFNAISEQLGRDRTFATRLASLRPDTFSDATLTAFVAASREIEPVNQASPAQLRSNAPRPRSRFAPFWNAIVWTARPTTRSLRARRPTRRCKLGSRRWQASLPRRVSRAA